MPKLSQGRFAMLADMIRSDQMSAKQVEQFLLDHSDFAVWYRAQFNQ